MKEYLKGFITGIAITVVLVLFIGASNDEISRYEYIGTQFGGVAVFDSKTGLVYHYDTGITGASKINALNGKVIRVGGEND